MLLQFWQCSEVANYIEMDLFVSTYKMLSSYFFQEKNPGNQGFPGVSDDKASAYNAGDPGSVPGLGRSPGEGNGNALQSSCLENPMDGGGC